LYTVRGYNGANANRFVERSLDAEFSTRIGFDGSLLVRESLIHGRSRLLTPFFRI
jgi:hypothetical protein